MSMRTDFLEESMFFFLSVRRSTSQEKQRRLHSFLNLLRVYTHTSPKHTFFLISYRFENIAPLSKTFPDWSSPPHDTV